mmetsp:Transcript_42420/g.92517  ORF Transcript_42420/g.92517 Transcript_42420/m.92517 type:complete len:213 (+) Transcript_42420:397-1035(+)
MLQGHLPGLKVGEVLDHQLGGQRVGNSSQASHRRGRNLNLWSCHAGLVHGIQRLLQLKKLRRDNDLKLRVAVLHFATHNLALEGEVGLDVWRLNLALRVAILHRLRPTGFPWLLLVLEMTKLTITSILACSLGMETATLACALKMSSAAEGRKLSRSLVSLKIVRQADLPRILVVVTHLPLHTLNNGSFVFWSRRRSESSRGTKSSAGKSVT